MKFTVASDQLSEIAKVCIKGLLSKDPHSQAVLKVEEDIKKLTILCTTQSTFFKGQVDIISFELDNSDGLEWAVDGVQLKTILSIIPSTVSIPVTFEMASSARNFVIKASNDKFRLPVYETISPYVEKERKKLSVLNANDFVGKLTLLSKVASSEVENQDLPYSCVHVIFDESEIKMMGTDTRVLAEYKIDNKIENAEEIDSILLPNTQAMMLSRTFEPSANIALVETDTQFGYVDENNVISLVSKSTLSEVPYESVKLRVSEEMFIDLKSSGFKSSVSSLGKLATNSEDFTFEIHNNTLKISNINGDIMTVDTFDGNVDECTLKFQRKALQVLESLMDDNVRLSWAKDDSAMIKVSNLIKDENANLVKDDHVFIGVVTNDD